MCNLQVGLFRSHTRLRTLVTDSSDTQCCTLGAQGGHPMPLPPTWKYWVINVASPGQWMESDKQEVDIKWTCNFAPHGQSTGSFSPPKKIIFKFWVLVDWIACWHLAFLRETLLQLFLSSACFVRPYLSSQTPSSPNHVFILHYGVFVREHDATVWPLIVVGQKLKFW